MPLALAVVVVVLVAGIAVGTAHRRDDPGRQTVRRHGRGRDLQRAEDDLRSGFAHGAAVGLERDHRRIAAREVHAERRHERGLTGVV